MPLDPVTAGLLTGGASIAADLFGSSQQREFNAKQAQIDRDWQEKMSNTAYQRAAKDMEAAGLNRILALGNPASTPSGAQASMSLPAYSSGISTGVSAASAKQQIAESKTRQKNIVQTTKNLAKTLEKIGHEVTIAEGEAAVSQVRKALYRAVEPIVDLSSQKVQKFINKLAFETAQDMEKKGDGFNFNSAAEKIVIRIKKFQDQLINEVKNFKGDF